MDLDRQFFTREVTDVARGLIGGTFRVGEVGGIIVETEAYRHDDAAAHSFAGPTPRNKSMFGQPGHAYVYRSYGLHWCLNFVCRPGCAVLIRALEPKWEIQLMMERRQTEALTRLCAGPGRLAQALAITSFHDSKDLFASPFHLSLGQPPDIVVGPRIGITKASAHPWRFGMANSPFLSRKF